MAGVKPTKFINYVSQFKKLLVTRNNGTITQKFKVDSNITDDYYFSIVNSKNQLVDLTGRSFKIYGSVIDAKDDLHILFYSDTADISENGTEMHFKINTYNTQYMSQIKNTKIIDLTIIEVVDTNENNSNQGGGEGDPDDEDITQVILRDTAVAYKRPYIDNVQPTELVYKVLLTTNVPLTGCFGSGQDISLTYGSNGAAFGTGLDQTGDNQLVIGKYNEADNTKVFVIGNGTNDTARSNLFTIDYDGNITTSGALSATAVYINGQEVGTQVDQKLASTSAWVNETFETKESSTSAYNSLVEEIGAVDLKVEGLSSTVVSDYALKSQLPTKVSDLTNDAGYITSSEIPTDYVTNGQLDSAISSFITIEDVPVYTGSGAVVVDQNHVISLTGQLGKTYNADNVTLELDQEDNTFSIKSVRQKITAGSGISLSEDQQTGITTISVFGSGTPGEAVQYFEGTGISIDNYTISINQTWLNSRIPSKVSQLNNDLAFVPSSYLATYATKAEIPTVPTNIGAFTNDVGYLTAHQSLADYYTKTQTDSAIAAATTDMATETYVNTASANIVAEIPNSATIIDVATGAIPTGVASFTNDAGYLTEHQSLTAYATKDYVDTASSALDNRLTAIEADYIDSTELATAIETTEAKIPNSGTIISTASGAAVDAATGWVDEQHYLTGVDLTDYAKTTDVTSAIEAASASIVGQIPLSTSELVNDSGYLTQHQSLEGYATETYVDGAIDTASASIVAQIPTSASQLANDVPYLTAHQSLAAYATNADLSSVSGTLNTAIGTKAASADVYSKSQVYTKTEADNKFLTEHQSLSNYYTKTQTNTAINDANNTLEGDLKNWVNTQNFAKTSQIPTVPTNVASFTNDAGYVTSTYVTNKIAELDQDTKYRAGDGLVLSTNNTFILTANIPSIQGLASETYVNNAVSTKADKSELEEVSGQLVNAIGAKANTTDLQNYVQTSTMSAYATSAWVDTNYAKKGEAPTDVYTKAEVNTISTTLSTSIVAQIPSVDGLASEQYVTGAINTASTAIISQIPDTSDLVDNTTLQTVSAAIVEQIPSTEGLATEADLQIVSAAIPSVQGLATEQYVDSAIETASGNLQTAINGKTTSGEVKDQIQAYGYQTATDVANAISGKADEDQLTAYYTKTEADNKFLTEHQDLSDYAKSADVTSEIEAASASIISQFPSVQGLASQTYVGEQINGISATISTNYALKSELPSIEGLATEEDLQAVSAAVPTSYVVPSTLNDYATTAQINYVSSVVSTLPTENTTYTAGTGLKLDGTEFSLTASIPIVSTYVAGSNISITSSGTNEYTVAATDTTYVEGTGVTISGATNIIAVDQEWLEGFVANLGYITHDSDTLYHADEETINLTVVNDQNTFSVNQTWLNNFLAAKEYATTGYVTGYCSGYALKSELPSIQGLASQTYVDTAIQNTSASIIQGLATESYVNTQIGLIDIPTAISDLTNDSEFATSANVSTIIENTSAAIVNGLATEQYVGTQIANTSATIINGLATESYVTGQVNDLTTGQVATNTTNIGQLSTDLTSKVTSSDVKTQVEAYQYQNATQVSGIVEGYNYATNTTVNGIDNRVSANETAITNLSSTKIDATSASSIASGVVQNYITVSGLATESYVDDAISGLSSEVSTNYALKSDIPQGVTWTGQSGIVVDNANSTITLTAHIPTDAEMSGVVSNVLTASGVALESDIPTSGEITGLARDYVDTLNIPTTYATKNELQTTSTSIVASIPTAVSQLTNDVPYLSTITSADIPTSYVQQSDLANYATKDEVAISATSGAMYAAISTDIDTQITGKGYQTSSDVATYLTTNNYVTSSTVSTALSSLSTTIEADIPSVVGLINASEASEIASAVTTGYLTGYYDKTSANATFAVKSVETDVDTLKAASGDFSNYYTKDQVVPSTSAAMYNAISGDVDDLITSKNYLTSITSSDITTALGFTPVSTDTTYSAGTGLKLTGTEFSLSAAGANEDKVLSSHNGTISWQTNVAGTDIDTVCGMLSSANNNLTISKTDNKILFTATGGGSSYSAGDYISLANDTIAVTGLPAQVEYISSWVSGMPSGGYTAGEGVTIENGVIASTGGGSSSGPTNKQLVSSSFTYDSTIGVYKNEYTPTTSSITMGQFTIPEGSIASNEVAEFEEWVTTTSPITGITFDGVILLGELPQTFTPQYYYVFKRIINSNGDQFIQFKYEFTTDKYLTMPLTIKAINGPATVLFEHENSASNIALDCSVDGGEWTAYTMGSGVTLAEGHTIAFSGNNTRIGLDNQYGAYYTPYANHIKTSNGNIIAYGNAQSLIGYNQATATDALAYLFGDCTGIVDASKVKLPAMTVGMRAYQCMFYGCKSLTAVPELPATSLTSGCYYYMFRDCTSLTSTPVLPASTLAENCYYGMFIGCPITSCVIQATNATAIQCCAAMFRSCTSIQVVDVNFTSWWPLISDNYITWFASVNAPKTGTFKKPSALPNETGYDRIPTGWTVVNKE